MSEPEGDVTAADRALSSGWGRVLVFLYGLFAVAAIGRSTLQLATQASEAPVAYSLSLTAAVIYLIATGALLLGGRPGWAIAVVAVAVELIGVVGVGTLTVVDSDLFGDRTLWSEFGAGYGFVPLVLPFLGMAWLVRQRSEAADQGT